MAPSRTVTHAPRLRSVLNNQSECIRMLFPCFTLGHSSAPSCTWPAVGAPEYCQLSRQPREQRKCVCAKPAVFAEMLHAEKSASAEIYQELRAFRPLSELGSKEGELWGSEA